MKPAENSVENWDNVFSAMVVSDILQLLIDYGLTDEAIHRFLKLNFDSEWCGKKYEPSTFYDRIKELRAQR